MKPKRVALIAADFPEYEKYCPNFTGMMDGLEVLDIEHKLFSCRPTLNAQAVIDYKPDLVIYGLLDMVKNPELRSAIRLALPSSKIVMWYGDLRNETTRQIKADVSEIDMMFVSNDAQNKFYEKYWGVKECHFLPLGSSILEREYNPVFDFDFVFIGSVIHDKGFLPRAMEISSYPKWTLESPTGLKIINGIDADMRTKVMKWMPTIYRSSKVILDQSHFTDIKGYTSNRFWIIPASGGFALTKRWPGCEEFYPQGTRVYFDTIEEALYLRDYYLENPEEREKIRLAGLKQAKQHTYDKRFLKMFEYIYGTKKS